MTIKLFQTGSLSRRKALRFFTKPLPRRKVFCGSPRIEPQNLRYLNQYHSGRMENKNGPEMRLQTHPALTKRMEVRNG